jgi:hypothetical protein
MGMGLVRAGSWRGLRLIAIKMRDHRAHILAIAQRIQNPMVAALTGF